MIHSSKSKNDIVLENRVTVTYHRMNTFKKMFQDYQESYFHSIYYSLSPKFNRDSVFKSGEGAGRSGSFFFFSHDRKWIVKTMTKGELSLFLARLDSFASHFAENQDSFLAKIFGVFTVNTKHMNDVHIMLMENTMQLQEPDDLRYIFDLKGSRVDRYVSGATKTTTTLKDNNFTQVVKIVKGK